MLIAVGNHVPVMPFGEVVASMGAMLPVQRVNAVSKSGTVWGEMLTVSMVIAAHCPGSGVKL